VKLGDLHRSAVSSSVELVHKFMVQPKFVELKTELILAVERVLLIPDLNFDGAIDPYYAVLSSLRVMTLGNMFIHMCTRK